VKRERGKKRWRVLKDPGMKFIVVQPIDDGAQRRLKQLLRELEEDSDGDEEIPLPEDEPPEAA